LKSQLPFPLLDKQFAWPILALLYNRPFGQQFEKYFPNVQKYKINLKVLKVENYESKTVDNSSSDSNNSNQTVKRSTATIEQMDKAKEKCLSFGIKKDTEEFGKCVLDIYK
jgi:hypothetical protein